MKKGLPPSLGAGGSGSHKRGQKGKEKKMRRKYAEQDEEDRALALQALGGWVGGWVGCVSKQRGVVSVGFAADRLALLVCMYGFLKVAGLCLEWGGFLSHVAATCDSRSPSLSHIINHNTNRRGQAPGRGQREGQRQGCVPAVSSYLLVCLPPPCQFGLLLPIPAPFMPFLTP